MPTKIRLLLTSFVIILSPISIHAAPMSYTENNGATMPLGNIADFFGGNLTFTKTCFGIPINLNCSLALDVEIAEIGGDTLELTVFGMSSTGSGLCPSLGFSNFPWKGTYDHSLPGSHTTSFPFDVSGVIINTSCGTCSGSLIIAFNNTGLGGLTINDSLTGVPSGDCFLNTGLLESTSGTHYRIF